VTTIWDEKCFKFKCACNKRLLFSYCGRFPSIYISLALSLQNYWKSPTSRRLNAANIAFESEIYIGLFLFWVSLSGTTRSLFAPATVKRRKAHDKSGSLKSNRIYGRLGYAQDLFCRVLSLRGTPSTGRKWFQPSRFLFSRKLEENNVGSRWKGNRRDIL